MNADQPIYCSQCSQCGQQQGFGQHGYSHCSDHTPISQEAARELLRVLIGMEALTRVPSSPQRAMSMKAAAADARAAINKATGSTE